MYGHNISCLTCWFLFCLFFFLTVGVWCQGLCIGICSCTWVVPFSLTRFEQNAWPLNILNLILVGLLSLWWRVQNRFCVEGKRLWHFGSRLASGARSKCILETCPPFLGCCVSGFPVWLPHFASLAHILFSFLNATNSSQNRMPNAASK